MYFKSADNNKLFVNLFVPSTLNWKKRDITVTQKTSFPYSDRTKLAIDGSGQFALMIRVPHWATRGIDVSINGESEPIEATSGEYLTLDRAWESGDTVDLQLTMDFQLSRVMDQPNIASIFHGPVLLAVEEPGSLSKWRQAKINTNDISQSIEGDPRKLRFQIGDLKLKPFLETYDWYSAYLDIVPLLCRRGYENQ